MAKNHKLPKKVEAAIFADILLDICGQFLDILCVMASFLWPFSELPMVTI